MRKATIVMYHYVRDLKHSRYPDIKGLTVENFKGQLEYFKKHYNIIRMEDLISAVKGKQELPEKALLLTFDDAYKDHYEYVFPLLKEFGMQGSFFPPAKTVMQHEVLDVNKIHFILASVSDKDKLIKDIYSSLDEFREEFGLESNEHYFEKLAIKNRFDPKEVIFIKRILQKELPERLRNSITDRLFKKYVHPNEATFSKELYMSLDEIRLMKEKGMYFGSHGYDHHWLNTLPAKEQEEEIDRSLDFLKIIGCPVEDWVMCYPYGAHNESLVNILRKKRCAVGLTTVVDIANLDKDDALTLPRLDTNDLPKEEDAEPNEWTLKAFEK